MVYAETGADDGVVADRLGCGTEWSVVRWEVWWWLEEKDAAEDVKDGAEKDAEMLERSKKMPFRGGRMLKADEVKGKEDE